MRFFAILKILFLFFTDTQIPRRSLFDFWRSIPSKGRLTKVVDFVKSHFPDLVLTIDQEKALSAFLKSECENIRLKWLRKNRRLDLFLSAYADWLSEHLVLRMGNEKSPKLCCSVGRPKKSFGESGPKTKNRKVQHLLKKYDQEELCFAAQSSVRASGKRDAAKLIQEVSSASPRRATGYKKAGRRIVKETKRPYTPEEALAMFISNDLTVQTYKNIQQESKERGFCLYPCYEKLLQVKVQCYPSVESFTLTDTYAEVKLQSLLDHTATRICRDILGEVFSRQNVEEDGCTMICKWGCDGSSGHSLYKQSFKNHDDTDEYMFVISFVPIRIIRYSNRSVIWENPRPSSPRFCRIIKFMYKKETQQLIKEECEYVKKQISDLRPTIVKIDDNGLNIRVNHELIMSMIDGKVCNVIAENKSSQRCYICNVTSKEMNRNIVNEPNEDMYQFGISSLHAYIRCMECLLNISHRLDISVWQVRGDANKEIVKKRKEIIKKKFKEQGLIIDKVKPGYGTSNDGNTARAFFHDYQNTSLITGIDQNLIFRLGTLLATISSGYEIDAEKFQLYCTETREKYISLYSWYNMPATMHKILVHGAEIIKHSVIPIGQMSEEASEAKNKEIRKVRLGHTLKISRVRTNFDLIKYLLMSSDPYITLLRKLPKKNCSKHFYDIKALLK